MLPTLLHGSATMRSHALATQYAPLAPTSRIHATLWMPQSRTASAISRDATTAPPGLLTSKISARSPRARALGWAPTSFALIERDV